MCGVVDAHSHSYQTPKFYADTFLFGREGIPLQGSTIINRFTNFSDSQLADWLARHKNAKLTSLGGVTLPLYGDWCSNFWHWVNEALPVAMAAHHGGFSGYYLVPYIPFVTDTLRYIGINPDRIRYDDGSDYHLECMCLLGKKRSNDAVNLEAMQRIRELVRARFADTGSSHRIYITRNGRPHNERKIVNEGELLALLERFGFITLHMEELALAEQLRHTCNASALVTPHGAAMAHCAFLPQGSLVLEHFAPVYVNPCAIPLCARMKHRYYQVTSNCSHWGYPHGQDIEANLPIIEMTLARELA